MAYGQDLCLHVPVSQKLWEGGGREGEGEWEGGRVGRRERGKGGRE